MRIVVALGGNALLKRGEPAEAAVQRENVQLAAGSVARLAQSREVVLTHGNGPQVGLLALQGEAYREVKPYPLDVLGAESEGMIGYLLEQSLRNELGGRETVTLLTQVLVDADDAAFARPSKPIGRVYSEGDASRLAAERGWTIAPDGAAWRRVVPSPEPRAILELGAIRLLLDAGMLVICVGGGGIPVVSNGAGGFTGVEAVIDKDLSAALLARVLGADFLLLLTDVASVERDWGTPSARPIRSATPRQLRELGFAAGSMGPKVEAACRFVETTGGTAGVGALAAAEAIVRGEAGTRIAPDSDREREPDGDE
jgi:carbamate kinase